MLFDSGKLIAGGGYLLHFLLLLLWLLRDLIAQEVWGR